MSKVVIASVVWCLKAKNFCRWLTQVRSIVFIMIFVVIICCQKKKKNKATHICKQICRNNKQEPHNVCTNPFSIQSNAPFISISTLFLNPSRTFGAATSINSDAAIAFYCSCCNFNDLQRIPMRAREQSASSSFSRCPPPQATVVCICILAAAAGRSAWVELILQKFLKKFCLLISYWIAFYSSCFFYVCCFLTCVVLL